MVTMQGQQQALITCQGGPYQLTYHEKAMRPLQEPCPESGLRVLVIRLNTATMLFRLVLTTAGCLMSARIRVENTCLYTSSRRHILAKA